MNRIQFEFVFVCMVLIQRANNSANSNTTQRMVEYILFLGVRFGEGKKAFSSATFHSYRNFLLLRNIQYENAK